jgi:pimeloyl-ACP methyl ester carboxylesterase
MAALSRCAAPACPKHRRLLLAATAGAAIAGLMTSPPPAVAWEQAAVPILDWKPCTDPSQAGFECATAQVPLDYSKPRDKTISLAVIRHRATDQANRIGSLFFNPGGPGGPGIAILPLYFNQPTTPAPAVFPLPVRERFDIVSWDPRGVGKSTSVQCFATAQDEANYESTLPVGFPATPEQQSAWINGWAHIAQQCADSNSAYLLPHVSTTDTAKDLDVLRHAVGDEQLNYQGLSYGTFLGAMYANLFPDKVRAMMLWGNVEPAGYTNSGDDNPSVDTFLRQNAEQGTAKTLNAFFKLCGQASTDQCAFSAGSPAATKAKWNTLLDNIQASPITIGDLTYDYNLVVTTTILWLYDVLPGPFGPGWQVLANLLELLWEGSTDPHRYPPPLASPGQQTVQLLAVKCAESPNPRDPNAYFALSDLATERAGAVGPYWVWFDEECAAWQATAADQYTGPWDNPTANPILVLNNTYDPATPYSAAVIMAKALANARLLTIRGYGHADAAVASTCANTYVSSYFIGGTLPSKGTVCRQDTAPFTTDSSLTAEKTMNMP